MTAEIDTGRVALAFAQTILSMLIGSGILDPEVVRVAADELDKNGGLGIPKHELAILADAMRTSVDPM